MVPIDLNLYSLYVIYGIDWINLQSSKLYKLSVLVIQYCFFIFNNHRRINCFTFYWIPTNQIAKWTKRLRIRSLYESIPSNPDGSICCGKFISFRLHLWIGLITRGYFKLVPHFQLLPWIWYDHFWNPEIFNEKVKLKY